MYTDIHISLRHRRSRKRPIAYRYKGNCASYSDMLRAKNEDAAQHRISKTWQCQLRRDARGGLRLDFVN